MASEYREMLIYDNFADKMHIWMIEVFMGEDSTQFIWISFPMKTNCHSYTQYILAKPSYLNISLSEYDLENMIGMT